MNAGKNRKRDLELLSEVYSEAMGYAGGRGSVNTQPGAGGTGDYDDSTGQITQRAEDQNPLENPFGESEETYEGEEESQQEKSAKQLSADGWSRGNADPKGNLLFHKAGSHAEVDTDGQINGLPSQQFFRSTGPQENEAEDAEDFGSPNSNRSGWGSGAFSHPGSNETTDEDEYQEDDEIMGIDVDDCEPGKISVVDNISSAHGIRDILRGIFGRGEEDENAAAAMRADETENRKNLRAQNRIAKKYGFNPDENAEDTDEYDTNLFKHLDKRNTDEAEKQGFDPGLKNVRHSDEDEIDREKYEDRWHTDLDDERDRKGGSNAGEYTHIDKDKFCGPAGGAPPGTYPVNDPEHAEAAKRLAHNAPNPKGIKRCADRALAKDSYYSSKGDRAMTQLTESYEQVINNGLL